MELTWITFPLFTLLFCGLAVAVVSWTRPSTIQVNQLEIIDVDLASGSCRGSVWANLFSPTAQQVDVQLDRDHALGFEIEEDILTWQGLPGEGLGGMLTRSNPVSATRSYRQEFTGSDRSSTQLAQLPLLVSSSRALFGQWWAPVPFPVGRGPRLNPVTGRVTGTIRNPFDFELQNCRLLVKNYAYILDKPLAGGEAFDIQTGAKEKTLVATLTRRTKASDEDNRSTSSPWDPTSRRVNRIANIMMFYDAAGGDAYTGMTHGYQDFTDLSNHLNLQRVVLVGEVSRQGAQLQLDDRQTEAEYDQVTTIVRIVYPLTVDGRNRRAD